VAARRRTASRRNWPDNLYLNAAGYYWYKTPKEVFASNPTAKKTVGLGRDFKLASAQARTANAEFLRRQGDVSLLHKIDGGVITFSSWCDRFEKANMPQNKNSAVSFRVDMRIFRDKSTVFSKQALNKVSPKEIADFLNAAIAQRGPSSAIRLRSRLFEVFRSAIEQGLIEVGKNPVEAVFKPTTEVKRGRLTLDEFKLILEKAEEEGKHRWIANAMLLALLSGQRREDIALMTFSQVKDGFLWVEQMKGRSNGNITKLRIPMTLRLDALDMSLADVIKRCRDNVISKSLIHYVRKIGASEAGSRCSLINISMKFREMRDKAEVKADEGKTPPSFHEIRSLAARLYSEQYGPEFAQALLGHKSAEMTSLYRDSRGREWTEVKFNAG
jgi:enterobacteria phage integrase